MQSFSPPRLGIIATERSSRTRGLGPTLRTAGVLTEYQPFEFITERDAKRVPYSVTRDGCSVPDVNFDNRAEWSLNRLSGFYGTDAIKLNGSFLRRNLENTDKFYWDSELTGFGLRTFASGRKTWIARYRHGNGLVRKTIGLAHDPRGKKETLSAKEARKKARGILASSVFQMHSQPRKKPGSEAKILFSQLVKEFWSDRPFNWKPRTEKANQAIMMNHLLPVFGRSSVASIDKAQIMRWRDGHTKEQVQINKKIAILSSILRYAEDLGYRPKGSNPARGIPRYANKRSGHVLEEAEYLRLGRLLRELDIQSPQIANAFRLIIYTGARQGEIGSLQWEWVQLPRLELPDSKTGRKTILLCRNACQILTDIKPEGASGLVFPSIRNTPANLTVKWAKYRARAGLSHVRLHDLRHSFASTALRNGIGLPKIGKLLGHADNASTEIYARFLVETPKPAADRISQDIAKNMGIWS